MSKVKPKYYYRSMESIQWYGHDVFYFMGMSNKITRVMVDNNGRDISKET